MQEWYEGDYFTVITDRLISPTSPCKSTRKLCPCFPENRIFRINVHKIDKLKWETLFKPIFLSSSGNLSPSISTRAFPWFKKTAFVPSASLNALTSHSSMNHITGFTQKNKIKSLQKTDAKPNRRLRCQGTWHFISYNHSADRTNFSFNTHQQTDANASSPASFCLASEGIWKWQLFPLH